MSCLPLMIRSVNNLVASVLKKRPPSILFKRHAHVSYLLLPITILTIVDVIKSDFFSVTVRLVINGITYWVQAQFTVCQGNVQKKGLFSHSGFYAKKARFLNTIRSQLEIYFQGQRSYTRKRTHLNFLKEDNE